MRLRGLSLGARAIFLAAVVVAAVIIGLVTVVDRGIALPLIGSTSPSPEGSPAPVSVSNSGDVTVTYGANGQTVTVANGHEVTITLDSTYWTFQGSSNPAVLLQAGKTVVSSTSCVPGGGCGTVTAHFRAMGPGRAVVTASRTSCGEALACGPDQSTYQITVVVTG